MDRDKRAAMWLVVAAGPGAAGAHFDLLMAAGIGLILFPATIAVCVVFLAHVYENSIPGTGTWKAAFVTNITALLAVASHTISAGLHENGWGYVVEIWFDDAGSTFPGVVLRFVLAASLLVALPATFLVSRVIFSRPT